MIRHARDLGGSPRRNRTQPTTGCTVASHRSLRKSNTIFFTRGTADREWPTPGEISEVSPLPHVLIA